MEEKEGRMKLTDTLVCLDCEELVSLARMRCPSCTSEQLIPLSRWVMSLADRALAKFERQEVGT